MSSENTTYNNNRTPIYIPNKLLLEIFKHLPVKSSVRFMSVCKSWYSLIKTKKFTFTHLNHQIANKKGTRLLLYHADYISHNMKYLLLCDNDDLDYYYHEFILPQELSGLSYCNSIMCLSHNTNNTFSYVLWNISLNKSIDIGVPNVYHTSRLASTHGFGFDASSNDYKLVWINYITNHATNGTILDDAYVYSLNAGCWDNVMGNDAASVKLGMGECMIFQFEGLHLDGVIHWIIYNENERFTTANPYSRMLTFDLRAETFGFIPLPEIEYNPDVAHVMSLRTIPWNDGRERLAYVHDYLLYVEFCWVMTEYNVAASWKVLYAMNQIFWRLINNVTPNGEIVVGLMDGRVMLVDASTRTGTILPETTSRILNYEGTYVESLVLL